MLSRFLTRIRLSSIVLFTLSSAVLNAAPLRCDLAQYRPVTGLAARVEMDDLVVEWDGESDQKLRARLSEARYEIPRGGLYVWAALPAGIQTGVKSRFFKRALNAGVLYVPGEMCFCRDASRRVPRNCLRLSFGAARLDEIKKGIGLLADALREAS